MRFLKRIFSNLAYNIDYSSNTKSIINKKKIVFTGTRPKELMKKIEELGGSIQSTINSKTFALITNNLDESTGKIDKANELKIPIYTSESFEKEFIN